MNEEGKKKREWVKTAAIIFLSVMLVLTFFSNTIMNYSLPEVATQYVQSGTITAKIRGSGVVESGDPYNVEVTETRKVASVAVKVGDTVQKDDVLMYLEDAESTELTEARTQLDSLKTEYEKLIVSADSSSSIVNKVENGNVTSTDTMLSRIDSYNNKITGLEKSIDGYNNRLAEIDAEISKLGDNTIDTSAEQVAVNNAQAELDKATSAVTTAEGNVTMAQGTVTAVYSAVTNAEKEVATCKEAETNASNIWQGLNARKGQLESISETNRTDQEKEELAILSGTGTGSVDAAQKALSEATRLRGEAETTLEQVKASSAENCKNADAALAAANAEYENAVARKTQCENALADAQRNLANKQSAKPDDSYRKQLENEKTDINLNLSKANTQKTEAEADLNELLAGFNKEVDLAGMLKKIRDQEKVVEELTEKSVDAAILAPIAGTVTALNVVAGESTSASTPVAVMQPEGKGYTLSFSVTNDQARTLSVGDQADLVNAWRYDDLQVTLASIKPDTTDPGQKKLLTFDVTGSVTAGQTLNVSVGQRSANYDLIVPNSAIREDNNGKFILIVESKPGPLNTRYIASRVDVEVLASDDTQSAISAALYGYEFVITTSTKPVEAGKQVRLAEGS